VNISDILDRTRPTVVEFWAPWCGPCRQMAPLLEEMGETYRDRVHTVRINADEHPDLARDMRVLTIPTMVVYTNGEERARRVGAQNRGDLDTLYAAAADGREIGSVGGRARFFRVAVAAAILLSGTEARVAWPFYLAAGAVFFSAVHDRCPVWQAIKRAIQKRPA